MYFKTKILFCISLILLVSLSHSLVVNKTENTSKSQVPRSKRQTLFAAPIYYEPLRQQGVQPVTVTPPLNPQPQPGQPIWGTLIPWNLGNLGLPNLCNLGIPYLCNLGNPLGGVTGGLNPLGGVGNVGVPGVSGGSSPIFGNLGGLLPGLLPGQQNQRCPVTQTLNCRCENILPVPGQTTGRSAEHIDILQQHLELDKNGDKEMSVHLSNDITIYQRYKFINQDDNKKSKVLDGFYSLKLENNKYLNLYYTIDDLDYTVKADVTDALPLDNLDKPTITTIKN